MKKTLLTITLALVIVFSALSIPAMALTDMEGYPIPDLEKPVSLTVRRGQNHEEELLLRLTQPESIVNLYEPYYIAIELDIKINNGAWFFDRTPGHFREPDIADYYEEKYPDISIGSIVLYPGSIIHDEHNSFDSWLYPEFIGLDGWDLTNNTYYFRYRYICEYDAYDGATGAYGYKDVVSLWSDIAAIGKGADSQIPTSLEAPQNLAGQIKKDMNQKPYFTFTHTIPESVIKANQDTEIVGVLDWRPEGGVWASETADGMAYQPGNVLLSSTEFTPPSFDADEIEKQNWQFRMCYAFTRPDGTEYFSPFSNIVTVGVDAWSHASTWAEEELRRAAELGLIPESLMNADFTKPITRAEFAAVSVKTYEALSKTTAVPESVNPFTDTNDSEVLKAYNLGITDGVGAGKFEPNTVLNREQAATMLARVFKKYSMSGWTLKTDGEYTLEYTKPAAFSDDEKISSWAKDSVYFMVANEIIKGTGNNMFSPRATTPAEQAINYASATREQALLIAVRMVENLD